MPSGPPPRKSRKAAERAAFLVFGRRRTNTHKRPIEFIEDETLGEIVIPATHDWKLARLIETRARPSGLGRRMPEGRVNLRRRRARRRSPGYALCVVRGALLLQFDHVAERILEEHLLRGIADHAVVDPVIDAARLQLPLRLGEIRDGPEPPMSASPPASGGRAGSFPCSPVGSGLAAGAPAPRGRRTLRWRRASRWARA